MDVTSHCLGSVLLTNDRLIISVLHYISASHLVVSGVSLQRAKKSHTDQFTTQVNNKIYVHAYKRVLFVKQSNDKSHYPLTWDSKVSFLKVHGLCKVFNQNNNITFFSSVYHLLLLLFMAKIEYGKQCNYIVLWIGANKIVSQIYPLMNSHNFVIPF